MKKSKLGKKVKQKSKRKGKKESVLTMCFVGEVIAWSLFWLHESEVSVLGLKLSALLNFIKLLNRLNMQRIHMNKFYFMIYVFKPFK